MAEAALDLSLDELIRRQREGQTKRPKQAGSRVRLRENRGGGSDGKPRPNRGVRDHVTSSTRNVAGPRRGAGARSDGGGAPRNTGMRADNLGVRNKGITKGSLRTGGGDSRAHINLPPSRPPPKGNPNGMWQHDLFDASQGPAPRRQQAYSNDSSGATGAKLLISNLDFNVSEEDIMELFSTCGPLRSFKLHYDRSGRSEGTAEVVFEREPDARTACRRYNNVALDGKKMTIEIVASAAQPNVLARLSSGISVTKVGTGGPARSGLQLTRGFQQGLKAALPGTGARSGMRSDKLRSRVTMDMD